MESFKLDDKARRELQNYILQEIEAIVFSTRRPRRKVEGGHYIEDDSGDLRRSIRRNRNFIKVDKNGKIVIDIKVMEYYKYLDDERRSELNWYLSEAIFEDKNIREKIRELQAESGKRTMIKVLKNIKKKLKR